VTKERIEVMSYSGYRGEETPRSFTARCGTIEITEILDRWIEEDMNNRTRKRFFKVKGRNSYIYKIYMEEETQAWFIQGRIP
jgi:hypothetical protein